MVRSAFSLTALCAALLSFGTATAAELVNIQGKVAVNHGDGFIPAAEGMTVRPGDKVFVGDKSSASLIYANPGCVFEAAPTSVVTVTELGPCAPGETTALGEPAIATPASYSDHDYTVLYIAGGAALLGGAAYLLTKNGNGNGNGDGDGDGDPVSAN